MSENEMVRYDRRRLVGDRIEARRLLNLDLDDLYLRSYAVQIPVGDTFMEVRFQAPLVSAPGGVAGVRAPSLDEVVRACAALGEMVMVPAQREMEVIHD